MNWAAGILGTGGLSSLVTVFIYGSRQRRKEREEKNKMKSIELS